MDPLTITTLPAQDWEVRVDVDDALSAASFRTAYQQRDSSQVWDPSVFTGVKLYRGEADPQLIQINADVNGTWQPLLVGVADGHEADRSSRGVVGILHGRDHMAVLLDRRPSSPFTLIGARFQDGPGKRLVESLTEICDMAGVPAQFHGVLDYLVGGSLSITGEKTYAEYLAELLGPLRLSEKYRVDAWFDPSGTLHFGGRQASPYPIVEVPYGVLESIVIERTTLPDADVRFEGFRWTEIIPSLNAQQAGAGWFNAWSYAYPPVTSTRVVSGDEQTTTTTKTVAYNARGQETSVLTVTTIERPGDATFTTRVETVETTFTYYEVPNVAWFGQIFQEFETERLTYIAGLNNIGPDQIVRNSTKTHAYFADNGDHQATITEEDRWLTVGTSPTLFDVHRVEEEIDERNAGQLIRTKTVTEQDKNGKYLRKDVNRQVGPYKVNPQIPAFLTNQQSVQRIVASPPYQSASLAAAISARDTSAFVFATPGFPGGYAQIGTELVFVRSLSGGVMTIARGVGDSTAVAHAAGEAITPVVTSPRVVVSGGLVADQASADQLRTWLLDERASIRHRATIAMPLDLRVWPGRVVRITGAPADFGAITDFYVTALAAAHRRMMRIEAQAWTAAP